MAQTGAFICGCEGTALNPAERAFIREADPWGLILFARNIDTPEQVRRLIEDFRHLTGRAAPVLIDQEGGRVQRLRPPHFTTWPAAAAYGRLWRADPLRALKAARLVTWLMGRELAALGIDVDCLPVLDVPQEGADPIIGDRAYATEPMTAALLARAALSGLAAAGLAGVVKHIPGHGRAPCDSHAALPRVAAPLDELADVDFRPFAALADAPMAMTAHVVYEAIDPANPATLSKQVIATVIRGRIGFAGLLMSDDLGMHALSGSMRERTERALAAGCDVVLHCSGDLAEMEQVAEAAGRLRGAAWRRAAAATRRPEPVALWPLEEAEALHQALITPTGA
ncbi:MAG TPA: beta-N-acetylhexosaminidase [Thermopetrobacter sp.]|nr:beta-N-acetylhexosaminidase [Thermopetrobacter sp.]